MDQSGNPVILRGMALYWSQWKGRFYNAAAVKWLVQDWKCTVIRASMAVENGGWPSSGEMDIMELLSHEPAKVYATVHWNSGGHQQQGSSKTLASGTFADGFHIFGYEWESGAQRWYIDDVRYFTTSKGQPFDKRFYLILNAAVGGGWSGRTGSGRIPDTGTFIPLPDIR